MTIECVKKKTDIYFGIAQNIIKIYVCMCALMVHNDNDLITIILLYIGLTLQFLYIYIYTYIYIYIVCLYCVGHKSFSQSCFKILSPSFEIIIYLSF